MNQFAGSAAAVLASMNSSATKSEPKGNDLKNQDSSGCNEEVKDEGKKTRHKQDVEPKFPVEPRVIQVIKLPKRFANHSYRDFSAVPPTLDYRSPQSLEEMSFSQKVHHMLAQDEYKNWIAWCPHGRAFRLLVPKRLEQAGVLQKYFGHSRFSSFLRQLNNYGFKHITKGADRNCYYHEFFLRGLPHLCVYMPPCKDARRLIPNPENEPNLYQISQLYPVPGCEENEDPAAVAASAPPGAVGGVNSSLLQCEQPPPAKLARISPPQTMVLNQTGTMAAAPVPISHARDVQQQLAMLQHLVQQQDQLRQQHALAAYAVLLQSMNPCG